ncbi:MAG: hypothetical protein AAB727_00035 [Patescibacteria group bacterium]
MEKSAEAARLVRGTRNQLVIEGFGALLNKAVISWLTSHCAEKRLLVVGQYACKGVGGPLYFELAHAGQAARTGMPSNAAALLNSFRINSRNELCVGDCGQLIVGLSRNVSFDDMALAWLQSYRDLQVEFVIHFSHISNFNTARADVRIVLLNPVESRQVHEISREQM